MADIKSIDRIMTARDFGKGGARGYIRATQIQIHRKRGIGVHIKDLEGEPEGVPIYARIWRGIWVADCECRGCALVDPEEPIYFCFECLNRSNGGKPRPVVFPAEAERREIERLVLERPVRDIRGLTDLDRAANAEPLLYVQVEQVEEPSLREVSSAIASNAPIPQPVRRTVTLPLPRSWEPGETIEDLRAQQEEPIRKWRKELREGNRVVQ